MIRRFNVALLAAMLISQPTCVRADGEGVFLKVVVSGVIVGGIWYACQPDSNETAVKKARNLIDDVEAERSYQNDEPGLRRFAQQNLRELSVDELRQKTIREREKVLKMHNDMRSRLAKTDYDIELRECVDALNQAYYALSMKLEYLDRYTPYLKFYAAGDRARALTERGCPSGYTISCAQEFRNAIDDIEKTKGGALYTRLHNEIMTETYPKLVKKYGDINKRVAENRDQDAAAWIAGQVVRGVVSGVVQAALTPSSAPAQPQQQARQTTAQQQEQAAVEQAKKNSLVTQHQEEAMRQAKARQERQQPTVSAEEAAMQQALLDDAKTQQQAHARCTYDTCQKGSGPECPAYQSHKNCTPDRCAKGLSQQACPAQKLYHAQCMHDTCYKGSAAQCPAFQAHRNCNDIWCNYHQDAWCPRFHDRSNLKH
jgi:hypothetical protein